MRNLVMLVLIVMLIGCSSSEDSEFQKEKNIIIGTWKPIGEYLENSSGEMVKSPIEDLCISEDRVIFLSNGDFSNQAYEGKNVIYGTNNDCTLRWDNYGSWKILNGDILDIKIDGDKVDGDVADGIIDTYYIHELTINTLIIGSDPFDNVQWYYELKRVN